MTIIKTKEGSKLAIALEGRLDTVTAPELEKVIQEELDGVTELVLELEKLEYVSSSGLRVILGAQKKMNKAGKMVLHHVNEVVMEVFDITGFTDLLTIE